MEGDPFKEVPLPDFICHFYSIPSVIYVYSLFICNEEPCHVNTKEMFLNILYADDIEYIILYVFTDLHTVVILDL